MTPLHPAGNDSSSVAPVLRKFRPADAPAVFAIAKSSPQASQWPLDAYLALDPATHLAWVIDLNGQSCGFLVSRIIPGESEILNLAILPNYRRRGFAHLLLREALAEFRQRAISNVFLEVRESNLPARTFYEKHGFLPTGRRPSYYPDTREAALLMSLPLPL